MRTAHTSRCARAWRPALQLRALSTPLTRRYLSTPPSSSDGARPAHDVSEQLRRVMRDVPQAVAVAVTRIPPSVPSSALSGSQGARAPTPTYHGATLSSFTSLTLHPHPLVAFSLRLPSRLADYLRPPPPRHAPSAPAPSSALGALARLLAPTRPTDPAYPRAELSISLLSRAGEPVAAQLARPMKDQGACFALPGAWDAADPPGAAASVGVLRCEVVASVPLKDVISDSPAHPVPPEPSNEPPDALSPDGETTGDAGHSIHGSELFICRVLEVQQDSGLDSEPLLYYRQKYSSVAKDDNG